MSASPISRHAWSSGEQPIASSGSAVPLALVAGAPSGDDGLVDELARDRAYVTRLRDGDERAFEELFRRYFQELWTFARGYVRSPEVAEELVHDVFAQVWEQRATWVVHDTVRRYLFGAVRNRAITALRRSGVAERWAEVAAVDADVSGAGQGMPSIEDVVRETELTAVLARAVDRLPVRRRQALLLRWQHQRSYAQIADAMGISVKGVEAALAKAIRTVREALDPLL